jgi:hypothetical protein
VPISLAFVWGTMTSRWLCRDLTTCQGSRSCLPALAPDTASTATCPQYRPEGGHSIGSMRPRQGDSKVKKEPRPKCGAPRLCETRFGSRFPEDGVTLAAISAAANLATSSTLSRGEHIRECEIRQCQWPTCQVIGQQPWCAFSPPSRGTKLLYAHDHASRRGRSRAFVLIRT